MIRQLVLCVFVAAVYGADLSVPKYDLDGKIVGGHETTIDKFPYQVSVQHITSHKCGGSIIRKDIVLTAAHCTNGKKPFDISVKAGVTDLKDAGKIFFVAKIIQHADFSMETVDNDIAILKLTNPITFNSVMQPIPLQAAGQNVPAGTAALISGWGAIEEGLHSVKVLRMAQTTVIDMDTCKTDYNGFNEITKNMLCASVSGIDACQGDSGGPLAANGNLIGVVSWGRGCARPKSPGVYTSISVLRSWIDEHIDD